MNKTPQHATWGRIMATLPSKHLTSTPIGHHAAALALPPTLTGRYLEIGCRRGHSLAALLMATRMTATVVDLWIPQYADEPNPGPHAVATALTDLGILRSRYHLISGNSHEILPLLASKQFDVILVDGDHTPAGAEQDLRDAVRLLNNKGRIWFDDAVPELLPVWRKVLSTLPQFQCTEYLDCARPWAEAVR